MPDGSFAIATESTTKKKASNSRTLLAAYKHWQEIESRRQATLTLSGEDFDAASEAIAAPWHQETYKIRDLPAQSLEDIYAKATVFQALLNNHLDLGTPGYDPGTGGVSPSEGFAWKFVNDILGLSKAPARPRNNPDGRLIALCGKAIAVEKAWYVTQEKICDLLEEEIQADETALAVRREVDRLSKRTVALQHQIIAAQPTTLAGLKAKADAILGTYYDPPDANTDLWSIAQDVARIEEASSPCSAQPEIHDRRLIKLCQEMIRLDDAGAAEKDGNTKEKLHDQAYEVRRRLVQMKAKTAEGIRWKARAMHRYIAPDLDLQHMPTAFMASLLQDVLGDVDLPKFNGETTIQKLAMEMGRLDQDADELAENRPANEANPLVATLWNEISQIAYKIMRETPTAPIDVMGKLMAATYLVSIVHQGVEEEDRQQAHDDLKRCLEDCLIAMSQFTGQSLREIGGGFFMTRRLEEIGQTGGIPRTDLAGAHSDADLIEQVGQYLADDARMWEIERNKPKTDRAHSDQIDAVLARNNKRIKEIVETCANTPDGIRAKARALKAFTIDPAESSPFLPGSDGCLEAGLIASILRDLVREGCSTNALPRVSTGAASTSALQLALTAKHVWADMESVSGTPRASELLTQWEALADAVKASPTVSLQDALVQLCYANNGVGELIGLEMPRDELERDLDKIQRTLFGVTAFLSRHLNVDLKALAEPCDGLHMNPFLSEVAG